MPHLSFTSKVDPNAEPVTFDITGTHRVTKAPWTSRTFTCLPDLPSGALDALQSSTVITTGGKTEYHAPSLVTLMTQTLVPEDRDDFVKAVHDDDHLIALVDLAEIVKGVVSALTDDRPTKP